MVPPGLGKSRIIVVLCYLVPVLCKQQDEPSQAGNDAFDFKDVPLTKIVVIFPNELLKDLEKGLHDDRLRLYTAILFVIT